MRRTAYDRCGGLDKGLRMAMDFDLFCRISKIGQIKHLPVFFGRFRSHTNNKSTLFNNEISETGFKSGSPKELTIVYQRHFKKKFPIFKWSNISLLTELLSFYDRRNEQYKSDRNQISIIRS
jgi:hypothetical protein